MKQTAVKWFIENLQAILPKNQFNDVVFQDIFKQAQEVEKQQLIQAAYDNMNATEEDPMQDAIDYYNETFKNK